MPDQGAMGERNETGCRAKENPSGVRKGIANAIHARNQPGQKGGGGNADEEADGRDGDDFVFHVEIGVRKPQRLVAVKW
jgi:hypothetical protein